MHRELVAVRVRWLVQEMHRGVLLMTRSMLDVHGGVCIIDGGVQWRFGGNLYIMSKAGGVWDLASLDGMQRMGGGV